MMMKINPFKIRPIKLVKINKSASKLERQFKLAKEIVLREDKKLLKKLSEY